jgi:hypothetical protein
MNDRANDVIKPYAEAQPLHHLRRNLLDWFTEYLDMDIMPDGNCVVMSFPFLDLSNDLITIFVHRVGKTYVISDDNTIIPPELDINPKRHKQLNAFREMFNSSKCSEEDIIQYSEIDGLFCNATSREAVAPATMHMLAFLVKLSGIVEYVLVGKQNRANKKRQQREAVAK